MSHYKVERVRVFCDNRALRQINGATARLPLHSTVLRRRTLSNNCHVVATQVVLAKICIQKKVKKVVYQMTKSSVCWMRMTRNKKKDLCSRSSESRLSSDLVRFDKQVAGTPRYLQVLLSILAGYLKVLLVCRT